MRATKIIIMGVLAAASWIVDWLLLKEVIYQNQTIIFVGWPSLATILGITFLTFFFLINRNRVVSLILDIIIVGAYMLIMPMVPIVLIGGGIFLVFLQLFEQRLAHEEKSRTDFSIRRVMSGSITLTVYGLLLLIGLNVYYNTQVDFKANPDFYYDKVAVAATKTVPYVTKNIKELSDEQKRELSHKVASDVVDRIKVSAAGYQEYFPFLFAIIVTGTLLTFAFLLRWAAMIVAFLIFRFLLFIKFFKLHKVPVEVEKLEV